MHITESDVEDAALDWLADLGWSVAYGPDIAPRRAGRGAGGLRAGGAGATSA